MDKKCIIAVTRKLVNGITADITPVQMAINLELPIHIQLLVGKPQ